MLFCFGGCLALSRQPGSPEEEGTASHHVAEVLIEKNGLTDSVELQAIDHRLSFDELIESLAAGNIDAVFLTGQPASSLLQNQLHAEGLQFMSFDRAEAYAALQETRCLDYVACGIRTTFLGGLVLS